MNWVDIWLGLHNTVEVVTFSKYGNTIAAAVPLSPGQHSNLRHFRFIKKVVNCQLGNSAFESSGGWDVNNNCLCCKPYGYLTLSVEAQWLPVCPYCDITVLSSHLQRPLQDQ